MLKRILLLIAVPVALLCAQTQSEMNAQARAEFERADAELNKTYKALLARLSDAESKKKLEDESTCVDRISRRRSFIRSRSGSRWFRRARLALHEHDRIHRAAYKAVEARSAMNTNTSNQSVERTERKAEGRIMEDEVKTKLAAASGGSAPFR